MNPSAAATRPSSPGGVVARALGLDVNVHASEYGHQWDEMAQLAVRRNPRRAHLVVSPVLGKHIPARPDAVITVGAELADAVACLLGGGQVDPANTLVFGYAETATCLGHLVAANLKSTMYVHSTRDVRSGRDSVFNFEETHSHAVSHQVLTNLDALAGDGVVVLVDDELTTGRTAMATIAGLQMLTGRRTFIIAALLDLRGEPERNEMARLAADLGVELSVVSVMAATLTWSTDVHTRAASILDAADVLTALSSPEVGFVTTYPDPWPVGAASTGRHGWTTRDETAASVWTGELAERVEAKRRGERVLVLGTEELMYIPLALAARLTGDVAYQSTTRSPVAVLDTDTYAVRTGITFSSTDDPNRAAYLYNSPGRSYDDVIVFTSDPDGAGHTAPLLAGLASAFGDAALHHVAVPFATGPTHQPVAVRARGGR